MNTVPTLLKLIFFKCTYANNCSFPQLILGRSKDGTTETDNFGGLRMTTFMIYLSDVQAGGHTIFPQAGISVQPKMGDALFWFNVGPRTEPYDTRVFHLG